MERDNPLYHHHVTHRSVKEQTNKLHNDINSGIYNDDQVIIIEGDSKGIKVTNRVAISDA
ncbi:MAG: hypothetical protein M3Z01_06115 [Thermoproteota archaeon]|nr:hypothetical protein [Thermoproteota archaeon]